MLVVRFVRPPYGLEIGIVGVPEELEPLVYKDIVDKEIQHAVNRDPDARPKRVAEMVVQSDEDKHKAGYGKYQEEGVIVFEEARGRLFVMVLVKTP